MRQLLILGKVWPEPASSAAGMRMLYLIRLFSEHGYRITFATTAQPTEYSVSPGEDVSCLTVNVNDSAFDAVLRNLQPQAVLFDRFSTEEQFGWRVAQQCPQALRILDTEDLHCLRHARHEALKQGREPDENFLFNDVAKREIASILRCDLSLIISAYEMHLLRNVFRIDPVLLHYLPFFAGPVSAQDRGRLPAFGERKHFISIGNFLHAPNADAVAYLRSAVWPLVRKELPLAEMHIYGAYMPDKIKTWHDALNGFLLKGRARSVAGVMQQARVCLAPLRFGAGLKGKLLDAMLNGTPSVTTAIGAEGMSPGSLWNGVIADSPAEMAAAAVRLYTDETAWSKACDNGFRIVSDLFSDQSFGRRLMEKTEELSATLATHRQRNFTGAMLMHHLNMGYKYMALWIEAKNKNPERPGQE